MYPFVRAIYFQLVVHRWLFIYVFVRLYTRVVRVLIITRITSIVIPARILRRDITIVAIRTATGTRTATRRTECARNVKLFISNEGENPHCQLEHSLLVRRVLKIFSNTSSRKSSYRVIE